MATLLKKRRFFRFYRFLHAITLISLHFILCKVSLFYATRIFYFRLWHMPTRTRRKLDTGGAVVLRWWGQQDNSC